jgi:hypothetical protein
VSGSKRTFTVITLHYIKITGGYRKAGTSSLKRFIGRIFTIVNHSIEASRNFISDFFTKRQQKSMETLGGH